jgi:Protein of unknown function (DUF3891)
MVLFPIVDEQEQGARAVSAWAAVQEQQEQRASAYWVVTQPSHAALAGDLAAALREDLFGPIDATVVRAIALHDAGWSMDDAEQIQRLRKDAKQKPSSFIEAPADRFLEAWSGSIETAEKFAPIGGYIVSRHFERISQRDNHNQAKLETFRKRERQRQEKLRKITDREEGALERLVDALQFCDLLSLYLCSGSARAARFDQAGLTVTREGDGYRLEPFPFKEPRQFSFSALRHPAEKGKKRESGATFYINL